MNDFNPYVDRNPVDFEKPKLNWYQRLLFSAQAVIPSILVIDVSHYNANGKIDFAAVRASGVDGVILKVSESDWYKDTTFEYNWAAALDNDLAVMLYHFFRANKTGEAQFSHFMACADNFLNYVDGHTAVASDNETADATDKATLANRTFDFCARIKAAGLKDGIYSSPAKVTNLFPAGETRWKNLAWQWVANWTSAPDYVLPSGWSRDLVKAWQFGIYPTHSWCPVVNGAGTVDCNRMYFPTQEALIEWLGQSTQTTYPVDAKVRLYGDTMDIDGMKWYFIGWNWISEADVISILTPPVDLPPDPPPANDTKTYTVTAEKTLARFIHSYNEGKPDAIPPIPPKPIFQIYPGDSITEGRYRYDTGATILVWPEPIRGDGGGDYYKMVSSPVAGKDLYLIASDGVLG